MEATLEVCHSTLSIQRLYCSIQIKTISNFHGKDLCPHLNHIQAAGQEWLKLS